MGRLLRRSSLLAAGVACVASPCHGQVPGWAVSVHAGPMQANGYFTAVRANGKRVTSDIDGGWYHSGRIARRLNRSWSIEAGYEGSRSREFRIDQAFPDDTDFTSADSFSYQAVTLGGRRWFSTGPGVRVSGGAYLAVGWYDDVSLPSAGPPYDRTLPLDIDVETRPAFGLDLTLAFPIGRSGLALDTRVGVTVVRFSGPFPDDPSVPGSGGDIDVPFNPAYVTLGLSFSR